jgi:hypothetical protein
MGNAYSYVTATSKALAKEITNEVDQLFEIKVDPGNTKAEKFMESEVQPLARSYAVASAAATVGIGALGLIGANLNDSEHSKNTTLAANIFSGAHATAHYAAGAYLALKSKAYTAAQAISSGNPAAIFSMKGNKAILKVTGHTAGERVVTILAGKSNKDKEPAVLRLRQETGGTGGDSKANLNSGGTKFGEIDLTGGTEGKIVLKVGESSITIKENQIVFDSPQMDFKCEGKRKFVIDKQHAWVPTGNLFVTEGDIWSGKNITASKKVTGTDVETSGGAKLSGGSPAAKSKPVPSEA